VRNHNSPIPHSEMSQLEFLDYCHPTLDNVLVDIDSVWKLTRWPRTRNWSSAGSGEGEAGPEARRDIERIGREMRRRKRLELFAATKLAAEQAAELVVDREWRSFSR